jgi:hypothetical protein
MSTTSTSSYFVITITKASADQPWIVAMNTATVQAQFTPEQALTMVYPFTSDETKNVLIPYHTAITGLPGYQNTRTYVLDSVTMQVKHQFDTLENANAAVANFFISPYAAGSIQQQNHDLWDSKRTGLGVTYTYNFSVE